MEIQSIPDLEEPIVNILKNFGGSARLKEIADIFRIQYPDVIKQPFFQEIVDGEPRWRDWIQRCRYWYLVPKGIVKPSRKRGIWELA
ncbi:hypothetical protein ACFLWZ_01410 [Chloroflexota bacterium]